MLTALTEFGRNPRVVRLRAPPVYGALDARQGEEGEGEGGNGVPRGSKRLAGMRSVGGWVGFGLVFEGGVVGGFGGMWTLCAVLGSWDRRFGDR